MKWFRTDSERIVSLSGASGAEECGHEATAFGLANSGDYLGAWMEGRRYGLDGVASLGVRGTDDYPAQLTPGDGSGAHQTRLDGYVQRTVRQIFASESVRGRSYGQHFGMGGDVVEGLSHIVSRCYHATVADDDGAYGDLAETRRLAGLSDGEAHEPVVGAGSEQFYAFAAGSTEGYLSFSICHSHQLRGIFIPSSEAMVSGNMARASSRS